MGCNYILPKMERDDNRERTRQEASKLISARPELSYLSHLAIEIESVWESGLEFGFNADGDHCEMGKFKYKIEYLLYGSECYVVFN